MHYTLNDIVYDVVIERKSNRGTYIRIREDLVIYVTTNYLTPKFEIIRLLDNNKDKLELMIEKAYKNVEKNTKFNYLGNSYNIVINKDIKQVYLDDSNIYIANEKMLSKWKKQQILEIYKEHLDRIYDIFEEDIPYPKLKVRDMKTRWGVCNKRDNSVTFNIHLLEYPLDKLDYVIVHELSHFVHFDHSKAFWITVSKYCPQYKEIRKEMKE